MGALTFLRPLLQFGEFAHVLPQIDGLLLLAYVLYGYQAQSGALRLALRVRGELKLHFGFVLLAFRGRLRLLEK